MCEAHGIDDKKANMTVVFGCFKKVGYILKIINMLQPDHTQKLRLRVTTDGVWSKTSNIKKKKELISSTRLKSISQVLRDKPQSPLQVHTPQDGKPRKAKPLSSQDDS